MLSIFGERDKERIKKKERSTPVDSEKKFDQKVCLWGG